MLFINIIDEYLMSLGDNLLCKSHHCDFLGMKTSIMEIFCDCRYLIRTEEILTEQRSVCHQSIGTAQ